METTVDINEMNARSTALDLDTNNGFGPIPEKRKKRAALLSAVLSFVIMSVLLGAFTQPRSKLHIVTIARRNLTEDDTEMTCKKSNDSEYYHVGVFIWSLNLIGIILGEFMNRFCLIFEEYFHLHTRHNGSMKKMISACFNDISVRAVLFGTLVVSIIITTTLLSQGTDYFKFEYVEVILSGIGSGSLVLYLLSLDSLSRVEISSLMENNNRLVANGLAWSYYFGYLKIVLPGLEERIEQSEWNGCLSSKKLFILMPRECYSHKLLSTEDQNIEVVWGPPIEYMVDRAGISKVYRLSVYKINKTDINDRPLYILAQYASPLSSLHDMSHSAQVRLSIEDRDEQAKLFLRTLEAILDNPSVPAVRNSCKLVPYARSTWVPLSKVLAEAVLEEMPGSSSLQSSEISLDELDEVNLNNDH